MYGFTFLLYVSLIKYCREKKISFNFPDNSYIIHIGGWKKLQDQKVSHLDFIQDTSNVLGVKRENIIDVYGFTEQMGTVYPECQYGYKHVPDHAHIISLVILTIIRYLKLVKSVLDNFYH